MNEISMIECPECHKRLTSNIDSCPNCGYPFYENRNIDLSAKKQQIIRVAGVISLIVAIVLFIVGITQITQENYNDYQTHYVECLDGYNDVMNSAKSYKYGSYFRTAYENIADDYKRMMDEDIAELWKIRITTLILCSLGIGFGATGIHLLRKKATENGTD